jgi:hypothetical protein
VKLHEHRDGQWLLLGERPDHERHSTSVESTTAGITVRTVVPIGWENHDVEIEIPWDAVLTLVAMRGEQ